MTGSANKEIQMARRNMGVSVIYISFAMILTLFIVMLPNVMPFEITETEQLIIWLMAVIVGFLVVILGMKWH